MAKLFFYRCVCARKIHNWNLWILLCFFFISRRVEVDKKNQRHHARHLNNYGLQKTIFHVSLPLDGVGHTREGKVFEFFWRSSVLEVGSNYGIRMVIKFLRNTWWCDFYTFLDFSTLLWEKGSLFPSQKTCWIDYWFPIFQHQQTVSGIIAGPKNRATPDFKDRQQMNGMLMKSIVVKDLSDSGILLLKCW